MRFSPLRPSRLRPLFAGALAAATLLGAAAPVSAEFTVELGNRATGNKTIDTGKYAAGSYNGTGNVNAGGFSYVGDGGTYVSEWKITGPGNYMSWVKKKEGVNPTYPKKVDSLKDGLLVTYKTKLWMPLGPQNHASRFGVDVWMRNSDGTKVEIMIDESGWEGDSNKRGFLHIDGISNVGDQYAKYTVWGPFKRFRNGQFAHWAWVLQRDVTKKRTTGSLDLAKVLRTLRGLGLQNGQVYDVRVGREAVKAGSNTSAGRFTIEEVTIPDLQAK